VDQAGRVERLPRLLAGQLMRGQPAQLVIDQRQELLRGVRIASIDRIQELCQIAHRALKIPAVGGRRNLFPAV
jgi:hypothetical protein